METVGLDSDKVLHGSTTRVRAGRNPPSPLFACTGNLVGDPVSKKWTQVSGEGGSFPTSKCKYIRARRYLLGLEDSRRVSLSSYIQSLNLNP